MSCVITSSPVAPHFKSLLSDWRGLALLEVNYADFRAGEKPDSPGLANDGSGSFSSTHEELVIPLPAL